MTFLPVVVREMSVLSRRNSLYWSRAVTSLFAFLVMIWLLVITTAQVSHAALGRAIFVILSALGFGFALLIGMQATSDSVSEEKRDGTLGLLFLTDLTGLDIAAGKFAASSFNAIFALLGVMPMLALAILLGGVTLAEVFWVTAVLLNTMFLSLSLGIFVSTLSKNERKAMVACLVGMLGVTAGPLLASLSSTGFERIDDALAWPSPFWTFERLQRRNAVAHRDVFFLGSLLFQHCLAWTFLLLAGWVLPRCVNKAPRERFAGLRRAMEACIYGRREHRPVYRAALLDRNAFLWLASRERVKPKYAWGIIAFFAGLQFWIVLRFTDMLLDLTVNCAIIFLIHLCFKLWLVSEVSSRLSEDRRNGALELLLSSPLSVREIADGQSLALRRLFGSPLAFLISAELLLMFLGRDAPRQGDSFQIRVLTFLALISTFLLDLWALKWVGSWLSLTGKSIERVLLGTIARILALPWVLFAIIAEIAACMILFQQKPLQYRDALFAWWGLSVVVALFFGASARANFFRYFRLCASERSAALPVRPAKQAGRTRPAALKWMPELLQRHWVIFGTVSATLLILAGFSARQRYWKHQVRKALEAVSSQGYPINQQGLAAFRPPVPPEQDAFQSLIEKGPVAWPGRWKRAWHSALDVAGKNPPQSDYPMFIRLNEARLGVVRGLTNFSDASWELGGFNPFFAPQLDINGLIALAAADFLVATKENRPNQAEADLAGLISFARLLRKQPDAIAQNGCFQALQTIRLLLEEDFRNGVLSSGTCSRIRRLLDSIDDPDALKRLLAARRVMVLSARDGPIDSRLRAWKSPLPLVIRDSFLEQTGSHDRLLAAVLKEFERSFAAASAPYPERLTLASRLDSSLFARWRATLLRRNFYFPEEALNSTFVLEAMITAETDVLRTALAWRQFQIVHSRFPEQLDTLVPEYLPCVPLDPFSGEPLRFRNNPDGRLVIYSVGPNSRDDGGRVFSNDDGDMVFHLK